MGEKFPKSEEKNSILESANYQLYLSTYAKVRSGNQVTNGDIMYEGDDGKPKFLPKSSLLAIAIATNNAKGEKNPMDESRFEKVIEEPFDLKREGK